MVKFWNPLGWSVSAFWPKWILTFSSCNNRIILVLFSYLPHLFRAYYYKAVFNEPLKTFISAFILVDSLLSLRSPWCFINITFQGIYMYWFIFINLFYYLFYFWLCWVFVAVRGLSLVTASRDCSSLRWAGFSLQWLLLLLSTGSRHVGFGSCGAWASVVVARGLSSCGSWALERRLSSCGTQA